MKNFFRTIFLGLFLVITGLAWFGKEEVFYFLAPTERIDAATLVIEGWISESALLQAAEEITRGDYKQVLVTSIAHESAYRMYSKGGLRFYLSDHKKAKKHSFQTIKIQAFGRSAQGVQAHAKVMIDSALIGEFTATDEISWHTIALAREVGADSITIIYDNDRRIGKEDRDLFINAIRLDSLTIPARHTAVRYDRGKLDGNNVFRTDYASVAEESAEFLITQGINDSLVQAITAPSVTFERTYASALTAKKYLSDSIQSIMVFSESVHARRTRLVYQRMLNPSVRVGIISATSQDEYPQTWWKERVPRNYVLLQLAKYLYTTLFFYPSAEDGLE